jgi:UDP-N-acetylglucosamine acyltransferase
MIDAKAIVHPKAQLGKNVSVGPNAIIGEHVQIGDNCEIRANAVITGHTNIGNNNQIGYGAIIGGEPQDISYKGTVSFVEIGDNNILREYVTVNCGSKENTKTIIGNNNFILTGVHVAHNCTIGNQVVLVNNVLLGGHVTVYDHAFLGGGAVVHQFCQIGSYAMIRGLCQVNRDIPPYFISLLINTVSGLNRVGLRRKGFDHDRRKRILHAYRELYYEGRNRLQAIEFFEKTPEFKHPDIELLVSFLKNTKRGISYPVSEENKEQIEVGE